MPYERLVAWAAGPISILAGWLATQITAHFGIFGSLGLGQDRIAHAIVAAVTFLVGAAVTYAAHHRWLVNLAQWWHVSGLTAPAVPVAVPAEFPPVELGGAVLPPPPVVPPVVAVEPPVAA